MGSAAVLSSPTHTLFVWNAPFLFQSPPPSRVANWSFQGSDDRETWLTLSAHTDDYTLSGAVQRCGLEWIVAVAVAGPTSYVLSPNIDSSMSPFATSVFAFDSHAHTQTHAHTHTHAHTLAHTHTRTLTHSHARTRTHAQTHTYTHTRTHTRKHTRKHTQHTRKHTHTHIHAHSHTPRRILSLCNS